MKATVARKAVQFVLPSIETLMASLEFSRKNLHIVIVDPLVLPVNIDSNTWAERAILYEHPIGIEAEWQRDFRAIARSKARLSWLHQMPSQLIQARAPYLVGDADTTYFGSAVRDGLVVAASGVQPHYDQMVSEWVLEALRALAINERAVMKAEQLNSIGAIIA
jgi:hypothetical protein